MDTAADKALTAAQVLIAGRTQGHGDAAVTLDRDLVAAFCGYKAPKHVAWLLDYMESIGLLEIHRHYGQPGQGRQRDTFVTYDEPPMNYVGPRTYAELAKALTDPSPSARILFVDGDQQNRRSARRSAYEDLQGGPRSAYDDLGRVSAGQPEGPHMRTFGEKQGPHMTTLVDVSAGQPEGPHMRTKTSAPLSIGESFGLSDRRESEGLREPVPGWAGKPPATGKEEAVAKLVRETNWQAWAARTGGQCPSEADLKAVTKAAVKAMHRDQLTLDDITTVLDSALAKANSWKGAAPYVKGAFTPDRIRTHLPAQLSSSPRPLPELDAEQPTSGQAAAAPATAATQNPELPPWCGNCDSTHRRLRRSHGGELRCWECNPESNRYQATVAA